MDNLKTTPAGIEMDKKLSSMDALTKSAKLYIENRLSIIPVGRDKKPLLDWKKYQTERAGIGDFFSWLNKWPDMQIGIVTGNISNLTVVDVDNPSADLSWLPETATAKTGSGGYHLYYNFYPGINNKARIKDKIDIRSEGGYVIAPPSSNLKGPYIWIKKTKIANFPINLFSENKPVNYNQVITEYIGYGQGARNQEMTRYIGHMLAKIHPSEWETISWPLIQEANKKNTPPLFDRELRTIFDSIKNKERNNTTERWYKQEDKKCTDLQLIVKSDYRDRYTWGTVNMDNSLAIIKRSSFIIVGAKEGQGKTTFTFDMACKNALLGHRILYLSLEMEESMILDDFARKYANITIPEEYHYNVPKEKQQRYEKKINDIKSITNLFFRGMRRGSGTTWEGIIKVINEFTDLDLIFIDNLDMIDGLPGETEVDRHRRITKIIMRTTSEKQIPIVLIHHHRKSQGKDYGADELTGSGKIKDNVDILIKVLRNKDPEAPYPDKYQTLIQQQKSRGYPLAYRKIYFIKGTFEDYAPSFDESDENLIIQKRFYEKD